ncbi:NAD(P)-binding protein [Bimuria novae-zelandiae CBS 107.79]|uniref:NAD(P)-binding protein n=1 Tax=Bimuria novae-zelandiae CBS 107.79 TaxID=1447943 RepID=A0A6A5W4U5_9PLEO|nr:NAD(P)-binding protein [Bimuria novae-zelandiae CBS 107.79]
MQGDEEIYQVSQLYPYKLAPYPLTVEPSTENLPESLGPHDVVTRVHAVSLNFRDVAVLQEGRYPGGQIAGGIPASDCAAEVVAVGSEVKLEGGDRVSVQFNLTNLTGRERDGGLMALGGDAEGVLAEYLVFEEKCLVKLPGQLTWEEASTIACAGMTAWTSLNRLKDLQEGSFALISMFGHLICIAAGIKPIITSSSNEKIEQIKKLSPEVEGINYKEHKDVAEEVLRLAGGTGVDYVINNIGSSSIPNNIKALRKKFGTVSLVGFLGGHLGDAPRDIFLQLLFKAAKIQGIAVGSEVEFEELNQFLEDKKFTFDNAPAAFDYLISGKHTGKVGITF